MTTIITRMYSDEATANTVADGLREKNFPDVLFDVIAGNSDVTGRMATAQVAEAEAGVYGPMIENGNALVVVRAPFAPFGAAQTAMNVMEAGSPMEVAVEKANRYAGSDIDEIYKELRIQHGYWADFLVPLISHREPSKEMTIMHGFWGDFVVPHLSKRVPSLSRTVRHGYWGRLIPHISKRQPSKGMTIRHGYWGRLIPHIIRRNPVSTSKSDPRFPFSNAFGLPMLINR